MGRVVREKSLSIDVDGHTRWADVKSFQVGLPLVVRHVTAAT